jgi:ABC-2 type transport system permease protein
MAGLVGVPYAPSLVLAVFGLQIVLSFMLTAFGLVVAARVKQMQSFMALTQMLVMPLFFLSGAMFPLTGLPTWLTVLNRIDPLTYAVDPMRRIVFDHLDLEPAVRARLDPGVTWGGWHVPPLVEACVVLALGLLLLGVAIAEFSRD